VLDVSNFGPDMVQAPNARLRGSGQGEDVLTLSVWAPQGATAGSLPVMVWLHGGGFVGGGASDIRSDGAALARLGVVVVAVNYRTGVFGWLAHPELSRESPDGVSGNWGLMDQLLALQWIREQISGFGGDASRVTLFGVSAGSASISLLLTAPAAAGLFHRAILHSPGAGRPLATLDEAEAAGGELGRLDALRALDAAGVAALTSKLNPAVRGLTTPRVLRPICDGVLLPGQERQALLAGRLHAMPIIVGSNTDEGSLLTASWPVRTVADWQALVQRNFGPAASQALAHYPVAGDADVRAAVAALFGDTQFNAGVRLLARAMAARGVPVWRYLFTRRRPGQQDGPHHGDEVAHAFGNLRASYGDAIDATDRALSASMMRAWAGFARDAEPDAGGELSWPRFDVASDPHRVLGHAAATASHWRASTLDFLDAYYASQGL
jgi:para-nitrobenzyl esterase